jgi:hypothetical protein
MCYQCFLLGAVIRADCVDLSKMSSCDYFFHENQFEGLLDEEANKYLAEVLKLFASKGAKFVPIKVEGDGHCLVHSISRSIGCTEHLYSALRQALTNELINNETFYKHATENMYHHDGDGNYQDQIDWAKPTSRAVQWLGPLHIFGLANVLKRPIILLDHETNPVPDKNARGLYLPSRFTPEECKASTPDGSVPSPIVISWASPACNHYVCLLHVLPVVEQEQPIGHTKGILKLLKTLHTGLPAGLVRACRELRSITNLDARINALEKIKEILNKCKEKNTGKFNPEKIYLNSKLQSNYTALQVDGALDFLVEAGYMYSNTDEEPTKKATPFNQCIDPLVAQMVLKFYEEKLLQNVDLNRMENMLTLCANDNKTSDITCKHQDGLLMFMHGIHTLYYKIVGDHSFTIEKKNSTAILECLRYMLQSNVVSDCLEDIHFATLTATAATNKDETKLFFDGKNWSEIPVLLCIHFLKKYNEGDKNTKVSLGGVLKILQLLANLLTLGTGRSTKYHNSTLNHLTTVLNQIKIFLTQKKKKKERM